jgi:5'-3' exonuclease
LPFAKYFGRTVAIDASTQLYQFLVQVRSAGPESGAAQLLMNEKGENTSHLQGCFSQGACLLEAGLKPVFVFDDKPPTLTGGELARRSEIKGKAEVDLAEANVRVESGATESEKHQAGVDYQGHNKQQCTMEQVKCEKGRLGSSVQDFANIQFLHTINDTMTKISKEKFITTEKGKYFVRKALS